jgi:hypothetical protein
VPLPIPAVAGADQTWCRFFRHLWLRNLGKPFGGMVRLKQSGSRRVYAPKGVVVQGDTAESSVIG